MLYCGTAKAEKYQLNKKGLIGIGKALLYSAGSAVIVSLITILPQVDFPATWLFLIPVINVVLVSAKKFFEDEQ